MINAHKRLDAANAYFLPIDYMHGLMTACRSIDPAELRNNVIALTKVAKLFGLPVIGTGDRSGMTYLGAEMSEIEELHPNMDFVSRSAVGAWDAPVTQISSGKAAVASSSWQELRPSNA